MPLHQRPEGVRRSEVHMDGDADHFGASSQGVLGVTEGSTPPLI